MRFRFVTLFFVIISVVLQAQPLPEGGNNIVNYKRLRYLNYQKDNLGSAVSDKAKNPADITLTVETASHPDFIYHLSVKIPLQPVRIEQKEVLLLSFEAKTIEASLETGVARTHWVFNVSENPKERIMHTLSISSDWKQYYIPIEMNRAADEAYFRMVLQFGFPPQKLVLRDLQLLVFPAGTQVADLPRTKIEYAGMEPDAAWREEALQRIEQHRKGDFQLRFTRNGKPVKRMAVQLDLKRHHFSWGAAMNAQNIVESEEHLQHFSEAFNLGVFANDLKIKFWNKPGRKEQTLRAIDLLEERRVDIKGHVLIWPGFRHLPKWFRNHKNKPEKLSRLIDRHLDDILEATRGKVSRWDVVNEAYTNTDLQEITGSEEILYNGFRKLHKKEPEVLRYVNEYGIISKGGLDKKKQEWYLDYIKRIDENTGGLVDGIGIQCHHGSDLPPPEKVLEILDFYASLNKKISISEFTMDIDDPDLRRQYTADFITAAFSHPAVHEFLFWGYQGKKADIFTDDWQLGEMGQAYFSLVHGDWKTRLVEKTDRDGCINSRGFFGTYAYTFIEGNQVVKGEFQLLPGESGVVEIELK